MKERNKRLCDAVLILYSHAQKSKADNTGEREIRVGIEALAMKWILAVSRYTVLFRRTLSKLLKAEHC